METPVAPLNCRTGPGQDEATKAVRKDASLGVATRDKIADDRCEIPKA